MPTGFHVAFQLNPYTMLSRYISNSAIKPSSPPQLATPVSSFLGNDRCTSQELVDANVPDGSFPLPALTLKRSGGVLDEAIAIIRNDRAAHYGQPGRVFSNEEMASFILKKFP